MQCMTLLLLTNKTQSPKNFKINTIKPQNPQKSENLGLKCMRMWKCMIREKEIRDLTKKIKDWEGWNQGWKLDFGGLSREKARGESKKFQRERVWNEPGWTSSIYRTCVHNRSKSYREVSSFKTQWIERYWVGVSSKNVLTDRSSI